MELHHLPSSQAELKLTNLFLDKTLGSVVGTILFLVAILSAMYTGQNTLDEGRRAGGLNSQHRVNVVVMIFEIGLLAITMVLIVGLFTASGRLFGVLERFYYFAPGWFSLDQPADWSRVLGVILFAFVGTGIFNLCTYSELFVGHHSSGGKARFGYVVALGTLIPMGLYILWTLVTAVTLSPEQLRAADVANDASHIWIAKEAASISREGAWLITLTGYLFALMAVTSACNGFTESLADRFKITFGKSWHSLGKVDFRPIILLSTALMALAIDVFRESFSKPIALTSILSIAGNAGGGLLILVLPFFFPYPLGRRTRAHYWEVAVVLLIGAVLVIGIWLDPAGGGAGTIAQIVSWGKLIIAMLVAGLILWLVLSEPPEPSPSFDSTGPVVIDVLPSSRSVQPETSPSTELAATISNSNAELGEGTES